MAKYDTSSFHGVFVAFNTCFDSRGELDLAAVRRLARWYADVGVKGLYVCGSTGEGFLMDVAERMATTEAVMEEVGDRLSIIVHVGAVATRDAVKLARHAESVKAHATAAVPNVYYRVSEAAIERHWTEITEAADLPFFIYNIPQLTGYALSMPLFNKMIQNERVVGIKNSSDPCHDIRRFKSAGGKDFIVFNGPDEQYLAGRLMGADGGIGGTYGCMPELYLKLEDCIVKGQIDEAIRWQDIITHLIYRLVSFPSMYGATKAIIRLRGIDIGQPRLPFLPVEDDHPGIRQLHQDIVNLVAQAGL